MLFTVAASVAIGGTVVWSISKTETLGQLIKACFSAMFSKSVPPKPSVSADKDKQDLPPSDVPFA